MPDVPPIIQPAVKSKAEKLAESSYLLGVLSILGGITALPAMVQSVRALIRIRKEGASKMTSRKAIFGLLFPACVLGLIIFFAFAALSTARMLAVRINCKNQLTKLSLATILYADDNNYPFRKGDWCDVLLTNKVDPAGPVIDIAKIFHCPGAPEKQRCSFALNRQVLGIKERSEIPQDTVMLFESDAGWNAVGGPEIAVDRHGGIIHIARMDGFVERVEFKDINKLRWNPNTNALPKP